MNQETIKLMTAFIKELVTLLAYQQDIPRQHIQDLANRATALIDALESGKP